MSLKSRHRFVCTRIGSLYGWTEGLSQTRFNSFFAGIPGQVQVQGKRKESVTLCLLSSYSFSLPCGGLSGVYGGSDQSREEVFSDLPLRKVSSRQRNLPGKLVGAPHGLVIGRGECLFIRGFISFIMNSKKSVRLISEVLKTSYNEWSAIPFVLSASRRRESMVSMFQSGTNCLDAFESLEITLRKNSF